MKTKFEIKDLELELTNLFLDTSASWDESVMEDFINWDIDRSEQLNTPVIAQPLMEEQPIQYDEDGFVIEVQEQLCKAALFIQEEDEYQAETTPFYEVEESLITTSNWISPEQRETNYKFYFEKLAKANNWSRLALVRESVLSGQKGKNGMYFFPVGKSKEFWAAYNKKKEQLNQVTKVKKVLYKKGA